MDSFLDNPDNLRMISFAWEPNEATSGCYDSAITKECRMEMVAKPREEVND